MSVLIVGYGERLPQLQFGYRPDHSGYIDPWFAVKHKLDICVSLASTSRSLCHQVRALSFPLLDHPFKHESVGRLLSSLRAWDAEMFQKGCTTLSSS